MPDFSYFQTPQFQARMRSMNDAMASGMGPTGPDLGQHLGCSLGDFIAYLQHLDDGSGVAYVPIGDDDVIPVDVPYGATLPPDGKAHRHFPAGGRTISVPREVLASDALGTFSDRARPMGQAAAAFEAQMLADYFVKTPGNRAAQRKADHRARMAAKKARRRAA